MKDLEFSGHTKTSGVDLYQDVEMNWELIAMK